MKKIRSRIGSLLITALIGWPAYGCLVERRCFDDRDCRAPNVCIDGKCSKGCQTNDDCGPDQACIGHVCQDVSGSWCPSDMVLVDGALCIDRYEASRPDATSDHAGSDQSVAISRAGEIGRAKLEHDPWSSEGVPE